MDAEEPGTTSSGVGHRVGGAGRVGRKWSENEFGIRVFVDQGRAVASLPTIGIRILD